MGKSKDIDALATALAKAQGQCKAVKKSGKNPHLKSAYVTLDDIINGIRQPLSENGLAYTQLLHSKNGSVKLTTLLMHESGQWIDSTVVIEAGAGNRGVNATQALGSSITYMKRYTLSAMLGIAAEVDDDGNGSGKSKQEKQKAVSKQSAAPKGSGNGDQATDGNGDAMTSPRDLLSAINDETGDYYKSIPHMLNSIRKVNGDKAWSWPKADDVSGFEVAYALLVEYAEGNAEANAAGAK